MHYRKPPEMLASSAISVVIPAYNAEKFLAAAIESVLAQTVAPSEIVVVDDGSTDGTAAVARAFGQRVRLLQQRHLGTSAARNLGILATTGDYLALLDADDLMIAKRLARQSQMLAENPHLDVVFGHQIDFRGDVCDAATLLGDTGAHRPAIVPGALFGRRSLFQRFGGFDPAHAVGEFIVWFSEAQRRGLMHATLPEPVIFRRIHAANVSRSAAQSRDGYTQQIKLLLDRRRRAA